MPGPITFRSLRLLISVSLSAATLAFGLISALPTAQAQATSSPAKQFLTAHPALRIPAQANRVAAGATFAERIQMTGNVPRWANAERQAVVAVSASADAHVVVLLQRDPSVQAAFKQFLDDQVNPGSPLYHQWISPEEVGELFGPTLDDVTAVSNWVAAQGLTVTSVSPDRMQIEATGTIATVSSALRTSFAAYTMDNGESRVSAVSDPVIPLALSSVIGGFKGLSETRFYPHSTRKVVADGKTPAFTNGTTHFLMPNDFSTIYDINSVYTGGNSGATIAGTAQRIAIIGRSRISATDVSGFANYAALTPNYTTTIVPNLDPGTTNDGNQDEATLDVDRIVGTARGAVGELLLAKSTGSGASYVDGVDAAINYEVNTLKDPIMTISFGDCEADNSTSAITAYDTLFQTAAAGGISTFVSSGDEEASGCSTAFAKAPTNAFLNINIICSSSYVTCVGGTEFNDTTGTYWGANNAGSTTYTSTGLESALGYIPEGAWNEPTSTSTTTPFPVTGTGGGLSTLIPKPSWQTALSSTPNSANFRGTPDISFSGAGHDGYFACLDYALSSGHTCAAGYFLSFSGTSASAPGMAGIAALLNTKLGAKQGNINPLMYRLAASTPNAFHDATFASSGVAGTSCDLSTPSMCNNSAPGPNGLQGGLAGYALLTGYDLATGLGSLDVANFLTAAATPTTVTTTLAENATPTTVSTGQNVTFSATLTLGTSSSTPTGTVQFYAAGTAIGAASTLTNNTATLTYAFATAGTYAITAIYSGDANFATSTASGTTVTVNPSGFTVTPATTTYNLLAGATTGNTDVITLASTGSFAGTVGLTCAVTNASGTAAGTCSLAPTSATLTAGSSTTSTLTINTTAGTSGALNVVVTGTSGSVVVTGATIKVNLTAPSYTMIAAPTSASVTSGATTSTTVTVASTNGFAGTVALTCSTAKLNASDTAAGSCSVLPTSVTLASGGSATTVATVTTTTGTSGSLIATIAGSGTSTGATIPVTNSVPFTVTLTAPSFTVVANPTTRSITSATGSSTSSAITVTSVNSFVGTVALTCAPAATCTLSPASVALTAGGTATITATITPVVGSTGSLVETVTGTGTTSGSAIAVTSAAIVTVNVSAPAFTLTPAPTSLTLSSGATTGNTDAITFTSVNGFAGAVAATCAITTTGTAAFYPPTCTVAPATVTLMAGGTGTAVVTIGSTTAVTTTQAHRTVISSLPAGGAILALMFFCFPNRRRRALRTLATLLLMASGLAALSGCGGGGNLPPVTTTHSSAGTYTVTVNGSGTTNGGSTAATASTTFTVTIN